MRHLQPEDLAPLVGLPNSEAVTPGLGSRRKNDAATALLGLPLVRTPDDWSTANESGSRILTCRIDGAFGLMRRAD